MGRLKVFLLPPFLYCFSLLLVFFSSRCGNKFWNQPLIGCLRVFSALPDASITVGFFPLPFHSRMHIADYDFMR
ncbi:hypothetical protein VTN00DRAFT_3556 [Thermoascus crustaceus]|uniref:uncharacterized protein n=1 Tax=Thermoascus crustaceus TaxID=5088 RepID=UPI003743DB6D